MEAVTLLALYPIFLTVFLGIIVFQNSFQMLARARLDLVAFFIYCICTIVLMRRMELEANILLLLNGAMAFLLLRMVRGLLQRNRFAIENCRDQIRDISNKIKSIDKDTTFYSEKVKQLHLQIEGRKALSAFTKEMGRLLDPELVKKRLLEKIKSLFPGEKVSISLSVSENDSVAQWVNDRKIALLVKDMTNEPKFSSIDRSEKVSDFSSLIAAPLVVGKNLFGLVRVDSKMPYRFIETDLQQLELYSNIAALALENSQLYTRVHAMAALDGLTGLATHKKFQERLTEEILRAARYRSSLSLVLLDIDHFKLVNDRFGHLAGDEVLKRVAELLHQYCREVDFPARYGGEEFVVILPETTLLQAFEFGETLRNSILERTIFASGQNFKITISAGCSAFPGDAQIPSQLIRRADERLYQAKISGRNRVIMG